MRLLVQCMTVLCCAHARVHLSSASPPAPQLHQVLSLYQEELLTAESFEEMLDVLGAFTVHITVTLLLFYVCT